MHRAPPRRVPEKYTQQPTPLPSPSPVKPSTPESSQHTQIVHPRTWIHRDLEQKKKKKTAWPTQSAPGIEALVLARVLGGSTWGWIWASSHALRPLSCSPSYCLILDVMFVTRLLTKRYCVPARLLVCFDVHVFVFVSSCLRPSNNPFIVHTLALPAYFLQGK